MCQSIHIRNEVWDFYNNSRSTSNSQRFAWFKKHSNKQKENKSQSGVHKRYAASIQSQNTAKEP
jgi:hypothetical protein